MKKKRVAFKKPSKALLSGLRSLGARMRAEYLADVMESAISTAFEYDTMPGKCTAENVSTWAHIMGAALEVVLVEDKYAVDLARFAGCIERQRKA